MKRLSSNAASLVDELLRLDNQSNWFGRHRKCASIVADLAALSDCKEAASIPCVCRFLFSMDNEVRHAAFHAVEKTVLGMAPIELLQLSDGFGWAYGSYVGPSWEALAPSDVGYHSTAYEENASAAILGLLSFHRNGYVREEAVRQLAQVTNGRELSFLLIRLNDWVKPVSLRAMAAVRERLEPGYIKHFADNIGLVAHLLEYRRNDVSSISDAVFALLLSPQHDETLSSLLQSGEPKVVRRFVKRSFDLPGEHHERLARHGLKSRDMVLRLWCARRLLSDAFSDEFAGTLTTDSFAPIRHAAYSARAEQGPGSAVEIWKLAAFDRHAGIRDVARFHLRESVDVDIHALYLRRLSVNPEHWAAIAGLSECAAVDDTALLRRYTHNKYPKFTRVAIAGLAHVLGVKFVHELVEWLKDESPAVARQAARLLEAHASEIDGRQLFEALQGSRSDSCRMAIVRLFYDMGKWKSLPWLIRSTALEDPFVVEHASILASSWLTSNKVFSKPNEQEREAIQNAYGEVGQDVPSSLARQLDELLPFQLP